MVVYCPLEKLFMSDYLKGKHSMCLLPQYRHVGLVVKVSASRAEDSRFESRLHRDFWGGVESYQ